MKHAGLALVIAITGCGATQPSAATPIVVERTPPAPTHATAGAPRHRVCRMTRVDKTPHGEQTTRGELDIVADGEVLTELRFVGEGTSVAIERTYDAAKRVVTEDYRSKTKEGVVHIESSWRRDDRGRVIRFEQITNKPSGSTRSNSADPSAQARRKTIVTFPQRSATGRWLRKEGRVEGAEVTRVDEREYDTMDRLLVEKTTLAATPERAASKVVSRFSYAGAARTPDDEESATTDATGDVTEQSRRWRDAAGRIVAETLREKGKPLFHYKRRYDAAGRPLLDADADGNTLRTYTWDGDCLPDLEDLLAASPPDAGEP